MLTVHAPTFPKREGYVPPHSPQTCGTPSEHCRAPNQLSKLDEAGILLTSLWCSVVQQLASMPYNSALPKKTPLNWTN